MRSTCTFYPFLLVLLLLILNGCWIPLPTETAIVVQVLSGADPAGAPVNDVDVIIDGETLVTGAGGTEGQVFKSLGISGDHLLSIDTASLTDPQGGRRYVLTGSHTSGDVAPDGTMVAYASRQFALADTTMTVQVEEGLITVVTIYVDELQRSPVDNQWLTDGSNPSSPYRSADASEFASTILPTFWWRQEPSLSGTVTFTFQLWEDDDGDTRYPLGIADTTNYSSAMNTSSSSYIQPDWQVPLAGLQRAEVALTAGQINLWWGTAQDSIAFSTYDVYYAPTTLWSSDWEENPVLRGVVTGTDDGFAKTGSLGPGTSNSSVLFRNGTEYTFGLRAQDTSANLDSLSATSTRTAIPAGSSLSWSSTSLTAVADSVTGGKVDLTYDDSVTGATTYRIYAAPATDFASHAFHDRFLRAQLAPAVSASITGLVNGVNYTFGVIPIDSSGNSASGISAAATPSSASAADTTSPVWTSSGAFTATTNANPGDVEITFQDIASDAATVSYRIYSAPVSLTVSDMEAMYFTDIAAFGATPQTTTLTGFVNGVNYRFGIRAFDPSGNTVDGASNPTLTLDSTTGDTTGPTWSTNTQALFSSLNWSSGSTVYPVGWTYDYNGFALGQDPAADQGEYAWRVLQNTVESKLGAFYAYSGYYYSSTDTSSHQMSGVSSNVDHRSIFSFMESSLPSTTVMGSPIDSNLTAAFKQRPAAAFASSLEDITAINPHTLNQMVIEYQTDEDGVAIVRDLTSGGNFLGDLKVLAMNRTSSLSSVPPYLQYKEFFLNYLDTGSPSSDDITDFFPSTQYPVFFSGDLADFDYRDPALQ